MFESTCDLDIDGELLYGFFGDEQENVNSDARLEDSSIEKNLNKQWEKPNTGILSNRSLENKSLLESQRPVPVNTLQISNTKLSRLDYEDQNKSNAPPVVLSDRGNKRKLFDCPSLTKRNKRERKFPGPAGLLPDLKTRGPANVLENIVEDDELNSSTMDELCSQGRCSGSVLEDEPWQSLLADLGPNRNILDMVNVASVKRKAAAKCFVGAKLPFLAAVLHHLDLSSPDPCVILRDPTGEIHGTLHREVWDQFGGELIVGSVMVIRNAGLLSTGVSCRRHYLNITANNLVTIYPATPKYIPRPGLHRLTPEEISQSVEKWRNLVPCPSPGMGISSPVAPPSLFNSSLSSNSTSSTPRSTIVSGLKRPVANCRSAGDLARQLHGVPSSSNKTVTPGPLRGAGAPLTHPGRNLLQSFSPSPLPTDQSRGQSRSHDNSLPSTSNFSMSGAGSYSRNGINVQSGSANNRESVTRANPTASNFFQFDPAVMKPKNFSSDIFPQSNSDRQPRNGDISTGSQSSIIVNNNNDTKLVLSQSTQLTLEEQSMVENVFDGIDTDSFFDDDF